jgi:hypothetical protein
VSEFTAAASWKRHEFTARAAASRIVFRRTFRGCATMAPRRRGAIRGVRQGRRERSYPGYDRD